MRADRPHLLAIVAIVLAIASSPSAVLAAPQASLPDIEDEVMCPICGTTLELSDAPQANRERELIRRLIDEGRSKDEIKDALVAEYGEEVLATPSGEGFDLVAWLAPLAIAAAAGGIGFLALRRMRRPSASSAIETVDPPDASRLDEDMSRYDL